MLKLNNCTAVCIDTENHALAARAARRCEEACDFSDIFVLSDRDVGFKTKLIPNIPSIKAYSDFVLRELIQHVETEYVLIFQWDGYIIDNRAWDADYMSYDYIGAPWPPGTFTQGEVGNGGFSLRSRRLIELTASLPHLDEPFEDVAIVRHFSSSSAISIAPLPLARTFSFEFLPVEFPTFGFHGHFNFIRTMTEEELVEVLHAAPLSFWSAQKPLVWIDEACKTGRPELAQHLYQYCRTNFPDLTSDWPEIHLSPPSASWGGWREREQTLLVDQSRDDDSRAGNQALVVLGMHRSGTSVLTQLLVSRGATAPATLLASDHQNKEGYWESRPIMELNDFILDKSGAAWDSWRSIREDDLGPIFLENMVKRAAGLIEDEFHGEPLIAVKDPRINRLYPLWRRAISTAGYSPRPVIILREPQEVALSLQVRDGIAIDRGLLLWLRYNLDAELHTRGEARCVLSLDMLQMDIESSFSHITNMLDINWIGEIDSDANSSGVFSKALRHHHVKTSDFYNEENIRGFASQAYRAFLDLIDDPCAPPPLKVLDNIREKLESVTNILGGALKDSEAGARQKLDRANFALAEYVAHSRGLEQHLADAREQRDQHASLVAQVNDHANSLNQHLMEAREQRDQQSARAVEAETTSAALNRLIVDTKSRTCADTAQIAALIVHSAELDRDLAQARAERDDHVIFGNQMKAHVAILESELVELRKKNGAGGRRRNKDA